MAWDKIDSGSSQTFGPVLVPGRVIPKNSWLPIYPDRAEGPRALMAAAMPFLFWATTQFAPVAPALSWSPEYPDQAKHVEPVHASRVPFLSQGPVKPVVPTGWTFFPDFGYGQRTHASHAPFFSKPASPPPAPYATAFYPDEVGRSTRAPWTDPSWTAPARQPLPPYSQAEFPDDAPGYRTHASHAPAWFGPTRQPLPRPSPAIYSDFGLGRVTHPSFAPSTFAPDRQPFPPYSNAEYPDTADTGRTHASQAPFFSKFPAPPPTPYVTTEYPDEARVQSRLEGSTVYPLQPPAAPTVTIGWLPVLSDVVRVWPAATYAKSAWLQELPRPPVIPHSWNATYPDQISRLQTPWVEPRVFVPRPALVLGWEAIYPDLVRRADATPSLAPAVAKPIGPPVAPYSAAFYPDGFSRAPLAPIAAYLFAPTRQPVPLVTSWLPLYPTMPIRLDGQRWLYVTDRFNIHVVGRVVLRRLTSLGVGM